MSKKYDTKEFQYQFMYEDVKENGRLTLPCRPTVMLRKDPKLILFTLARHKTVSKLLKGYKSVLEVGCGDGFASRLIHNEIESLHSIDYDPYFIKEAKNFVEDEWPVTFNVHNILDAPFTPNEEKFDAAFSLDVLEHIEPDKENIYMQNVCDSIKNNGIFICGCPSLESQIYASKSSKEGHVNCKTGEDLKALMLNYFDHAFLFSMNDEVLHTGFNKMSHYNLVLSVGNKK